MTLTPWTVLIGLTAACLLLGSGYLIGIGRGRRARDALRQRLTGRDTGLRMQVQELSQSLQHREAERDRDDGDLRTAIREVLGPLIQREQVGYELAHLELGTGERGELPRLLDDIAEKGGFATVLLSDDAGLPLAASEGAQDLERLAGLCSLVMLVADRLSRDAGPAPLAVIVHDEANHQLLSRVFSVGGQQLLLTAVTAGTNVSPTALDPTLPKVEALLAPAHAR